MSFYPNPWAVKRFFGLHRVSVFAGALLVIAFPCALAQSVPDPTLDEVLARLDQNRIAYYQSVPNFFCSEHVVSEMQPANSMKGYQHTETDSTFRLLRTVVKHVADFQETRAVKAIDGRVISTAEQKLQGPSILSGVFSSGLETVSTPSKACFRYKLKTHRSHRDLDRIEVEFADLPKEERGPDCPLYEHVSGKVTIDPASMEVVRVERHVPLYQLFPGVLGPWTWVAEYGKVALGDQVFWMPVKIHSKAIHDPDAIMTPSGPGRRGGPISLIGGGRATWTFVATYTDFHRMQVSAHILGSKVQEAKPEEKQDSPKP